MRILLVFGLLSLLIACNESQKPSNGDMAEKSKTSTPVDTISEETFLLWTGLWDSLGVAFTDTLLVRYYDMPIIDLLETIGEAPAGSRFYHGLKPLGNDKYEAHLILTATNASGQDFGLYYDITSPCPPLCRPK